jgi:hypothetical protein
LVEGSFRPGAWKTPSLSTVWLSGTLAGLVGEEHPTMPLRRRMPTPILPDLFASPFLILPIIVLLATDV